MIPILYADDGIAVCIKPVGVASDKDGMPALLRTQLGGEFYPVHRLDTAVGGVMVYARTPKAAAALSEQIRDHSFQKEYLAVAQGAVEPAEGEWSDLLFHDRGRNKSYVVKRRRAGVREAGLDYRVLETRDGLSLLHI
ncbi:MAG: RluA family pseudouridine synthase, partial [Oscillospiraceae bacterium]|nr:RluA family pseudouridine synthase [Oscillospiraceae bacterium]